MSLFSMAMGNRNPQTDPPRQSLERQGPSFDYMGSVPYESPEPEMNPIQALIKKIGTARMAGILGTLSAPVRQGESSFIAGLTGFQQGKERYLNSLREQGMMADKSNLEHRRVAALEGQADAAKRRAGAYETWATARANAAGQTTNPLQKRITDYMGLTEEQKAAGKAAGIIRPVKTPEQRERESQVQAEALVKTTGGKISIEEAMFLQKVRPYLTGTMQEFVYEDPQKRDKILGMQTRRQYGVPRRAQAILNKAGMSVEDLFGSNTDAPGEQAYTKGPGSEQDVIQADQTTIQSWLSQPLTDIQRAWIRDELEERALDEEYEGADADSTGFDE